MKFRIWPKAWWARVLVAGLLVVLLPYLYSRLASASRRVSLHQLEGVKVRAGQDSTTQNPDAQEFRIACYNIAHGRGLADSNSAGGDLQERMERLDSIAALLREVDADVVVLNEVDFDASWSYGENQAHYLAEKARFPYWVEQRNLDFRVLFWTWRFGNAVLSKHPIRSAKLLPLPAAVPWESWLVGQKQGVGCEIEIKGQPIQVIAVHLEHRSEEARVASVKMMLDNLQQGSWNQNSCPTLLVGDLNSTPTGFPVSATDVAGENAIDMLDNSNLFRRRPEHWSNDFGKSEFTYRSDKPDRVIDWILIPCDWQFRNYTMHPSQLSDHRLIFAEVER